ncbi:GH92 family glycosyl hydrolase [Marinifilum caeruleilacunae]|uniref:Glycoside hydrolase family 92 protein n=1 Tax=Marinifilum caeruleilacunae TaxID=2499076 RepID=A0ABX1WXF9_9BACT|nr:GH92 family glycosyl hydrolase [Marinifilum caeruleilacunae]NOU60722.1 glycoside hydrolase family 92 protein [Marinifilum caeruleilacunae]
MNKHFAFRIFLTLPIFILLSCVSTGQKSNSYIHKVDPYIGSGGHGHVFVGANLPFGMVQLGPNNVFKGWDWCSGYHYSDSTLTGFAHTHLSGTGIGDYGDLLFMPVALDSIPKHQIGMEDWTALYTHDDEHVQPGYYSIHIDKYNVFAELTATERVGVHRYTFKNNDAAQLIIDLHSGIGWDQFTDGKLEQIDDYTIAGHRFSKGWSKNQKLYFHAQFSLKIKSVNVLETKYSNGSNPRTFLIEFEEGNELMAKTALSPIGIEGAKNNLTAEVPHWDFNKVKMAAEKKWNDELLAIEAKFNNPSDEKIFYTALYHTAFFPSLFNDHNGDYIGVDDRVVNSQVEHYTVFSLWDTYRALHPLFTITQADKVNDMVNTMLEIYKKQGKLPVWHLSGSETNTMIGNHAIPVIVDAYLKGFDGFDAELAFEAIKASSMLDFEGMKFVKEMGFIPADSIHESVAIGLEYAIDDWCVAAMAKKMGKTEDYNYFSQRAKAYTHYFDKDLRFMRGKLASGEFREVFDPVHSKHRADDYCEGNAWQYTWLVPHDPYGLIDLFGGEDAFVQKLDSLFTISSDLGEEASSDISGLIGQYAHGNEPGHHTTYLYAFVGQQWKTAKRVRQILKTLYHDAPNGLSGNEDCGQMSAWYIYSALGFYPVNSANGVYVFGSPVVSEAKINLAGNRSLVITTENNNDENIYIQSVELNGKSYHKSFITHKDIVKGGTLKFVMGAEPNFTFGSAFENRPQ